MSIIDLIIDLKDKGIRIELLNDQLKVKGNKTALTNDLLSSLKMKKDDIISYLKRYKSDSFEVIRNCELKSFYKLSSSQRRLYLLQQMDLYSIAYNIPNIFSVPDRLSKSDIERVFKILISRHEIFRTSFEAVEDLLIQRIHPEVSFSLSEYQISKEEISSVRESFIQSFDLSIAPLFRIAYLEVSDGSDMLMLDMHHIISDGRSHAILAEEFTKLLNGEEIKPVRLQYKDYCEWQNSKEQQDQINEQKQYWLERFSGEIPVLQLPTDFSRPKMQDFTGSSVRFMLSSEETSIIRDLCKEHGLTPFMSLLFIYNILLSKLSGQEDIIVGLPIAARRNAELDCVTGMFVNTLALHNEVNRESSIRDYFHLLKENTLEAYENQEYPFEDLVEKIVKDRDTSRNPLFDVMFNYSEVTQHETINLIDEELHHIKNISKFDLSLTALDCGSGIELIFEYSTKLFKPETIERFIGYFKELVKSFSDNSVQTISELNILTESEKRQLLYEFNDTARDYPKDKVIHQLFEEQVKRTPDNIAVLKGEGCLTYRELNSRANQLSRYCRNKGVVNGSKIGLLADHSLLMLIGMLGIMKSGGCYVPIDSSYPEERIHYTVEDSEIDILFFSQVNLSNFRNIGIGIDLDDKRIYQGSKSNLENINKPSDLSYIIYTSGSTGKPKGVIVEHRNVVSYISAFQEEFCLNSRDVMMQQASISFDTFVEEVYPILTQGGMLAVMGKDEILDVEKIGELILNYNITVISCSPLLLNEINLFPSHVLLNVRLFISGGDQLRYSYINNIIAFSRVYNTYGPTETTVCALYYECEKDYVDNIPIGSPILNSSVYVLGNSLELLPVGVAGEICIGGTGLSRGYANNDNLTAEKFILHPFKKGERLYRSGDLARWMPDGNIEFLGRIDQQVKIRGYRIELGEIESTLLKYENIKECVVLAREDNDEKYLCAYIICENSFDKEECRSYIKDFLPDYMIPSYFVELDELPLTTNGKLNRKVLPFPEVKASDKYVAPSNKVEEKLVEIWSEVLNVPREEIGVKDNFFALGGHSLKASMLMGKIHKEMGVKFTLKEVFLHSTIRDLYCNIGASNMKDFIVISKAEHREYYDVSSAQKRLFILQQMEPKNTAYNMPMQIHLPEIISKERLELIFSKIISRHENFRTSFEMKDESLVQRIHSKVDFKIIEETIEENFLENKRIEFIRPFDLSQTPLLRVELLQIKGRKSVLIVDMHHIICDGHSHTVLEEEFNQLLLGEKLDLLRLQYKDFSEWQNSKEQQERINKQKKYWLNMLSGELQVLDLPFDYTRPLVKEFEGAYVHVIVDREQTDLIKALVQETKTTLYIFLLSVFNILLSKICDQEDIIIGTPVAGRNHVDLEKIIGVFLNTLIMRNFPIGEKSYNEFLSEVKNNTLQAYENQEYQFEDIVDQLNAPRDIGRNPVFDVLFNLIKSEKYNIISNSDTEEEKYVHSMRSTKFDLYFRVIEGVDIISLNIEYRTKLFKDKTINRIIGCFKRIIEQILQNPQVLLSKIDVIEEKEKENKIRDFNSNLKQKEIESCCIQNHLDKSFTTYSENVAIRAKNGDVKYSELYSKAIGIATLIQKFGIKKETFIGIYVTDRVEVISLILGIIKSGCVFVPLDNTYPLNRIKRMIKLTAINCIFADKKNYQTLQQEYINDLSIQIIDIENNTFIESISGKNILEDIKYLPDDSIYIYFTSGTTGTPKAIIGENKSLLHFIDWEINELDITQKYNISQFTSIGFDVFLRDIFVPLCSGGTICIIEEESMKDSVKLVQWIDDNEINLIHCVPSLFKLINQANLNKDNFKSLKYILLAGEKINPLELKDWYEIYNDRIQLLNVYGPTETTLAKSAYRIKPKDVNRSLIPVNPIKGSKFIILDKYLNICPIGVKGEVHIRTPYRTKGYYNAKELNIQYFIKNPFNLDETDFLYKTGDLGRELENGQIELLGRIDNQIKIRGIRIELEDIRSVMLTHGKLDNVVVTVVGEKDEDKLICAYYIPKDSIPGLKQLLHDYLKENLPTYMIPSYYVEIQELPLTPNGKIDKTALPKPEVKVGDDYIAPTNEIESALIAIWSEVLNIPKEKISINANFFDLGGHSLKANIVISKINYKYKVFLLLADIFAHPTISEISALIGSITQKNIIKDTNIENFEL
ncbi:MAG: amino acid adenylation domain-containing protein [Bacteroidales bacterium]|nr:amino acid adenylation domain-containing protein [Bacteroidales bacterium]